MKPSLPGGFVCFFIGVMVFGVTTTSLELTCPIDKGTGVITKSVEVIDVEGKRIDYQRYDTGCEEAFSEFTYAVKLKLVNKTLAPGFGMVTINFYHPSQVVKDYASVEAAIREIAIDQEMPETEVVLTQEEVSTGGKVLLFVGRPTASKLFLVDVPAEADRILEETIEFRGFGLEEITHTLSAVLANETACPICRRTGKVSLVDWLRIKAGVY